jgi:hypothetical protein
MFLKRLIFLLHTCLYGATCFALGISSTQVSESVFNIKFVPDKSEAVLKGSIRFSVDSKGLEAINWEAVSEPSEEYIVPIKLREKVYRGPFTIKLFMNKSTNLSDLSCLFSCLLFKNDESVIPFFTSIDLLKSERKIISSEKKASAKKEDSPARIKELIVYHRGVHDSSKVVLLGLILLFLFSFLIINVLSFTDMAGFLFIGGWLFFGRILFSYPILLSVVAITLICTSFFLLSRDVADSSLQRAVRTIIGVLSALAVLPVVAEVFLTLYFGQ